LIRFSKTHLEDGKLSYLMLYKADSVLCVLMPWLCLDGSRNGVFMLVHFDGSARCDFGPTRNT